MAVPEALRPKAHNPTFLSARDERKDELLVGLKERTISLEELTELEGILHEDLAQAKESRDIALSLALSLALGLISVKKLERKGK